MEIANLVRDNIRGMRAFSTMRHGDTEIDVLLDANESPYGESYSRYPDPYQGELRAAVADLNGVAPENLIFGNGSDELIDIIIRTFCQPGVDEVRYLTPTFGMYGVGADIQEAIKRPVPLDQEFDIDVEATLADQTDASKLLILCSPNNPTANLMSADRVEQVISQWRGIVVLDEAYIQFVDGGSLSSRLDEFPNLIILQTFSKAYAAAGLRVGVGFASREIISYLNIVKPPYNVNNASLSEALRVLGQQTELKERVQKLISERARVGFSLENVKGVQTVYPSDANFLLVKFDDHAVLYSHLLDHASILVRDISHHPQCEQCLRVSIGTSAENDQLLSAINHFYN